MFPSHTQAHTAPLGIAFFGANGESCAPNAVSAGGAFPCDWVGDAFVAQHGSWNRDVPVGNAVVRLPFSGGVPTGVVEDLLRHAGARHGVDSAGPRRHGGRPTVT